MPHSRSVFRLGCSQHQDVSLLLWKSENDADEGQDKDDDEEEDDADDSEDDDDVEEEVEDNDDGEDDE